MSVETLKQDLVRVLDEHWRGVHELHDHGVEEAPPRADPIRGDARW